MATTRFDGTLEPARGGGCVVALPADAAAALGGARVRVRGTLNGVAFRSNTMSAGGGRWLGVHRATREAAGAGFGDTVTIEVERDDEPRPIEIPPDLARALAADPAARSAFEALSPTRRREHAGALRQAKREDTRARRLAQVLEQLRGDAPHDR